MVVKRRRTRQQLKQFDVQIVAIPANDHPRSVRQIFFYGMSGRTLPEPVEKTEHGFNQVKARRKKLQRAGKVPYGWITDATKPIAAVEGRRRSPLPADPTWPALHPRPVRGAGQLPSTGYMLENDAWFGPLVEVVNGHRQGRDPMRLPAKRQTAAGHGPRSPGCVMRAMGDVPLPEGMKGCKGSRQLCLGYAEKAAEVRRILEHARRNAVRAIGNGAGFDFSDLQELRVRLIRHDAKVWPPHADMLARIERLIAAGELERTGFQVMAGKFSPCRGRGRKRPAAYGGIFAKAYPKARWARPNRCKAECRPIMLVPEFLPSRLLGAVDLNRANGVITTGIDDCKPREWIAEAAVGHADQFLAVELDRHRTCRISGPQQGVNLSIGQVDRIRIQFEGRDSTGRRQSQKLQRSRAGWRVGNVGEPISRGLVGPLVWAKLQTPVDESVHGSRRQLNVYGKGIADGHRGNHSGKGWLRGARRLLLPAALGFRLPLRLRTNCLLQDGAQELFRQLAFTGFLCWLLRLLLLGLRLRSRADDRAQPVTPVDQELASGHLPRWPRLWTRAGKLIEQDLPSPRIVVLADDVAQIAQEPWVSKPFLFGTV